MPVQIRNSRSSIGRGGVKRNSLFQIDAELDELLEEIQEQAEAGGEVQKELLDRFHSFCHAHGEKVDRIGRFVRMREAREQYCRSEAARLGDRARFSANKADRTKSMVFYFLKSRDLRTSRARSSLCGYRRTATIR